ncbi:hypothetical protein ACHAQA_010099, partial [Verticillium albo-atrum]
TAQDLWVDTYWNEGHICFTIQQQEIKTERVEWALQTEVGGSFCFRWQGSKVQTVWTRELAASD